MKRRTYVLWKKILFRLSILTIIIGFLYIYLRTGTFTIRVYELVGVPEMYQSQVLSLAENLAHEKVFKILPGNRIITFHRNTLRSEIKTLIPTTARISIYPKGLHTLRISLTEYVPLFRMNEGKAITKDGIVYMDPRNLEELPIISVATETPVTASLLTNISDIVPKISTALFAVRLIEINQYGDVFLKGGERNEHAVIFSETSDVKKIWSNIVSAIDTNPLKTKLTTSPQTLEYLDTRFGNKVFYKFRPSDTSSHSVTASSSPE